MNIDLKFPHQLTDQEARERVKKIIAEKREQFKNDLKFFEEIWQTDGSCVLKCKVLSYGLSAKIEFLPGAVRIVSELPVLLQLFHRKIEAVLKEVADKILTPA